MQNYESFVTEKAAENKLLSSYLRLTDYTNNLGGVFLPKIINTFNSVSATGYPAQIKNKAIKRMKFAVYQKYANLLLMDPKTNALFAS